MPSSQRRVFAALPPALLALSLVLPLGAVEAQSEYTWLAEDTGSEVNVSGVVRLPTEAEAKAKLVLNYTSKSQHYAFAFTQGRLKAVGVTGGKVSELWPTRELSAKEAHSFVIKRRPQWLAVFVDGELMGRAQDPSPTSGKVGTTTTGEAQFEDVRLQEVAPVYFTDDFMRANEATGEWEPVAGDWKGKAVDTVEPDPERSANAFSYGVSTKETGLAVAGHWFWDNYLFQTAVQPETSEALGLVFFYQDPRNYALFRWHSELSAETGHGQELVWVREGQEQVAAAGGAGYQEEQWYALAVKATDTRVSAFVEGQEVLTAEAPPFGSGRIGLYAAKCERVLFDDVFCKHWEGPADDPSPFLSAPKITTRFTQEDTMSGWADPNSDWEAGGDGWQWNRGTFWGDASLSAELPFIEERGGNATLLIHAPEPRPGEETTGDPAALGYALTVQPAHDGSTIKCALSRQGKPLGVKTIPGGDWPVHVELRRHAGRVLAVVGEDRLFELPDPKPLPGTRTGLHTVGMRVPLGDVVATGTNYLDDTFSQAPVHWWRGKGTWHVTNRWTCQPGWTWLSGTDSLTPILWSKTAVDGDFTLEAFMSNKMDLRGTPGYSHPGDMNVSVCCDGRTVGSGYSCLYGGWNYSASALFRRGEQVTPRNPAHIVRPATSGNMDFHRHWFRVRVERRGNTLRHYVDDTLLSEFTDPNPLPGGRIAFWYTGNDTYDSGLMLARVRLWYEREAAAPPFPSVHWEGEEGGPWDKPLDPLAPDLETVTFDFEKDLGGWSGFNRRDGGIASLDAATAAGGKQSLKITNAGSGGDFTVWAGIGPFDARKLGKLKFAYKVPPEVKVNLYLQTGGHYYSIEFTGGPQPEGTCRTLGKFENIVADDQWHTATFDLGAALERERPGQETLTVNQVCFSAPKDTYYRVGLGGNGWGATYHLDDFQLSR